MLTNQPKNHTHTHKNKPSIEARRKLKGNLPTWLADGWTLNPVIIRNNNGDKKCDFLNETGIKGSPRIIVKSEADLHNCNALLGRNPKYAILDIDDFEKLKLPSDFPKPFRTVRTGKGYHLYFYNGDFEGSHKLEGGDLQYKTMGVFMPGSFHPVSEGFYEVIKETDSKDKLYFKDIKPFLLKSGTKNSWEKGNRNNTLNKLIFQDLSTNQGRNIPEIIESAKEARLPHSEIQRTTQSAIKGAISSGVSFQEDEQKEKITYTPSDDKETDIKNRLKALNVQLRFNLRDQVQEIKRANEKWETLSDGMDAILYSQCHKDIECPGKNKIKQIPLTYWNKITTAIIHQTEIDPFKEWLNALPKWDEIKRLENVLTTLFTVKGSQKKAQWAFKTVLLMAVKRTFQPGAKFDNMVILIGPQDIGKSSLWSCLFEQSSWFSDSISFSGRDKEIIEGTTGCVLVENAELSGARRAEIEKIKALISRQVDKVRFAYARKVSVVPRQFLIVGTTNEQAGLPNDLTGLRRFVPISLDVKESTTFLNGQQVRKYIKENRKQLWAEAIHLYKNKESHFLPPELHEIAKKEAEDHRFSNELLEEAVTQIAIPANGEPEAKRELLMADIIRQLEDEKKLLSKGQGMQMGIQREIGAILRKLGFEKDTGKYIDHSGSSRKRKVWVYGGN